MEAGTSETKDVCPECNADLIGGPIPEDIVKYYIPVMPDDQVDEWLQNNPWPTWHRKLGIEIMFVYDGVLIWQCPDCGFMWPRFSEEYWGSLHRQAQTHIAIIEKERNVQDHRVQGYR